MTFIISFAVTLTMKADQPADYFGVFADEDEIKSTGAPEKIRQPKNIPSTKFPLKLQAAKKILVVYFSRTGEEYNVGNITKGNTSSGAYVIMEIQHRTCRPISRVNFHSLKFHLCRQNHRKVFYYVDTFYIAVNFLIAIKDSPARQYTDNFLAVQFLQ